MQFLPSTWKRYGHGGDIHATGDAILAAARLLRANGGPTDMAAALHAYNPSRRYVRAVSAYASQLRANQRAFIGYSHWQVFYGDNLLPRGLPGPAGHASPGLIAPLAPPSGPRAGEHDPEPLHLVGGVDQAVSQSSGRGSRSASRR